MARKFASGMTHVQEVASDTWTINHGLLCKPVTAVFVDYEGKLQEILPAVVEYPSDSQVIVRFSQPFSGEARLI